MAALTRSWDLPPTSALTRVRRSLSRSTPMPKTTRLIFTAWDITEAWAHERLSALSLSASDAACLPHGFSHELVRLRQLGGFGLLAGAGQCYLRHLFRTSDPDGYRGG